MPSVFNLKILVQSIKNRVHKLSWSTPIVVVVVVISIENILSLIKYRKKYIFFIFFLSFFLKSFSPIPLQRHLPPLSSPSSPNQIYDGFKPMDSNRWNETNGFKPMSSPSPSVLILSPSSVRRRSHSRVLRRWVLGASWVLLRLFLLMVLKDGEGLIDLVH